jgi:hypothetical protein
VAEHGGGVSSAKKPSTRLSQEPCLFATAGGLIGAPSSGLLGGGDGVIVEIQVIAPVAPLRGIDKLEEFEVAAMADRSVNLSGI